MSALYTMCTYELLTQRALRPAASSPQRTGGQASAGRGGSKKVAHEFCLDVDCTAVESRLVALVSAYTQYGAESQG
eukprot:196753-Prymnesium_polylepis.1